MVSKLVYVGNLGEGYDLATVIRAVAADPALTLDIAGDGPHAEELRRLARSLRLESRVRFHGYLGSSELAHLLATCEAGVIPMRDDSWVGLPYKLCDYLAAGLPVLSSLHGECGELIRREDLGLVYDGSSVESLLAAVKSLSPYERSLPDALCADRIYRDYVRYVCQRTNQNNQ